MTATLTLSGTDLHSQVRMAVARALRVPLEDVADNVHFSSLGLDSLAAAELTAEVEDLLGRMIAPAAVHEYPTVDALVRYIEQGDCRDVGEFERMRADAVLPDDIRPEFGTSAPSTRTRDARAILLTGATGFLGAHLVKTLLDETDARILCLVRDRGRGEGNATKRVRDNLSRYGLDIGRHADRVEVVEGDLARTCLGMTRTAFNALANEVDAVIHGGAQVDWIRGYEALRDVNVLGTQEILRLACRGRPKPVHFISSLGVCHSSIGPRTLDEGTDAMPFLEGLRLGYAQSKCVSESLMREVGRRGLPVSIVRPALVSGDSIAGRSNVDDLLTRFIAGCVEMKAAPDLDWQVDCLPVDQVARAIVRLVLGHDGNTDVMHISARKPRHWRECVLWMRLCGFELQLLPYRQWNELLRDEATPGHPLHPLRSFFLNRLEREDGLTLPELYEESRRARITGDRSHQAMAAVDCTCSTIDSAMLDRYFASYVAEGVLPVVAHRFGNAGLASAPPSPSIDSLIPQLERSLAARSGDDSLSIEGIDIAPMGGDDSIVSELTSWREGAAVGLFRGAVRLRSATGSACTGIVVKVKASDESVLEVAQSVANLAGASLGEEYARFRDYHGFTRCHVRELALYRESDPRLRRHSPAPLAFSPSGDTQRLTLVLEELPRSSLFHAGSADAAWSPELLNAVIDGAAEIHSVWYGRETDLMARPWLAPVRDSARLIEMRSLWSALADHACAHSPAWNDPSLVRIHRRLVECVSEWSVPLTRLPRTLIHNDFNPRNIAILAESEPRLCAFDWELATIGVPQRDIAELLCWTIDETTTREEITDYIERSRSRLAASTGMQIDVRDWELGFSAALCELLVDRLAMYAMVDRFRPQEYLPRIVRGWMMLHRHLPWGLQ
ncbi:MAG TPA: thioester reductase domain-containing protein [Gemmatimonadaceae bacterium]|nr:thioester reductase domain-containing protein [Gemmatimonadaceae bacterium]